MIPQLIAVTAAVVVVLLIGTRRIRAVSRLRGKTASPPPDRACEGTDAVHQRLLALGGEDSPMTAVLEKDGILTVTWQLNGVPWATQQFQQQLRETWALDLVAKDGAVQARTRKGQVSWVSPAATWMPRAEIKWTIPLSPPIPDGSGEETPVEVGEKTPRSAGLLIETVRHCVVQSGHRFEHVLEFTS